MNITITDDQIQQAVDAAIRRLADHECQRYLHNCRGQSMSKEIRHAVGLYLRDLMRQELPAALDRYLSTREGMVAKMIRRGICASEG